MVIANGVWDRSTSSWQWELGKQRPGTAARTFFRPSQESVTYSMVCVNVLENLKDLMISPSSWTPAADTLN